MEEIIPEQKFAPIQYIEDFMLSAGMSQGTADIITYIIACVLIVLIIWITDRFGSRTLIYFIKKINKKTKSKLEKYLYRRKFFHRTVRIIPTSLALYFTGVILKGYSPAVINTTEIILKCVLIVMAVNIIISFLNAINDMYEDRTTEKSIKGYIQTVDIIIWIIAIIAIVSTIFKQDPKDLILALGASAAIITLVFRDIILGFVASIQLSAQDMIRRGDWITMPTRNADGEIQDITLTTVRVQNWDNTETMVPIYSMISESFTNWRKMRASDGRRFLRHFYVDISSIEILPEEKIKAIESNEFIAPMAHRMSYVFNESNTSTFTTNIGLFRSYVEAYVEKHPNINSDTRFIVRYLQQDNSGMKLEIYAFSTEKYLITYEKTIADILEHVIGVAPVFGIRLFQIPSGTDIRNIPN